MNDEVQPRLWIFAGPNGAGKSTLFEELLEGRVNQVNADDIARDLNGGFTENFIRAGRTAVERRKTLMAECRSLSIETTLAGNTAVAYLKAAKDAGYVVNLAYVGIDTPESSRARIDVRVATGGHDVPQDAVIRRHGDSMRRLGSAMEIADRSLIFDNSGSARRLLMIHEEGAAHWLNPDRPDWFEQAVPEHMRRFERRVGPDWNKAIGIAGTGKNPEN